MSQLQVNRINDASGGVLAPISSVMRNRIINGQMTIDQRNGGSSVATTTTGSFAYSLDRWAYLVTESSKFTIQQNAGSVTPPAGFTNYLGCTSTSAYSVVSGDVFAINQLIEGYNVADLDWGTANAKTVTLSFWVRSSLTGTFGGALANSGKTRNYPFSYSIPVANTWTQISVTVAGDTTGTWEKTTANGLQVIFSLGAGSTFSGTAGAWTATNVWQPTGSVSVVGTNGATFYITGVQLERGTQATSFEYRQYQQEFALCQRYFCLVSSASGITAISTTNNYSISFPVVMRAAPSVAMVSARCTDASTSDYSSSSPSATIFNATNNSCRLSVGGFTGMTTNRPSILLGEGILAAPAQFSAEL
jgi:hypothetical protein